MTICLSPYMQYNNLLTCNNNTLLNYLSLCYFYVHCRSGCTCCVPQICNFMLHRTAGITTRCSPVAIFIPSAHLTVFKHYFIYHVISLWNSLPTDLQTATTFSQLILCLSICLQLIFLKWIISFSVFVICIVI